MEMGGLVGSVETPALYPEGTQVLQVPGAHHDVPGNPVDGCSSVCPEPLTTTSMERPAPEKEALKFVNEYGKSVADTAEAALGGPTTTTVAPDMVSGQDPSVCVQLENNFFLAAFAAGLFPDRPAYADPLCTVGLSASAMAAEGQASHLCDSPFLVSAPEDTGASAGSWVKGCPSSPKLLAFAPWHGTGRSAPSMSGQAPATPTAGSPTWPPSTAARPVPRTPTPRPPAA